MLFGILGLDFWTTVTIIFIGFVLSVGWMAKQAASNPMVQKGFLYWLFGK
jgi:hypothetical protein